MLLCCSVVWYGMDILSNLVENYGPDVTVVARAEDVLLADDQDSPERREVLHEARLDLLYRRVRGDVP